MYKLLKINILACACVIIAACTGVNLTQWHFPYMMEVQQGTYITNDQYKQLKIGMTKEQVAYILGHPLPQYMFDQNRWDFIYQHYKNNSLKKNYSLTIIFDKSNKVTSITRTGDFFDQ